MNQIIILIYILENVLLIFLIKYLKIENTYQYLLEFPQEYSFGKEQIESISLDNELVKTIQNFCIKNNIYQKGAIISLSGGVDSMVVMAILIRLALINDFPIFACSLNYNLRPEQKDEMAFLKDYCNYYNVECYFREVKGYSRKKEDSGPRTEFEEESRKTRFSLYKEIIENHGCNGVFVGHHKDDIIENIFTNSMKGGNLLDLEVMKEISTIHSVNIFRPLLKYHKDKILEIAHQYNIPYFLDTTPKWSRRGKMRNEIFPLFDNVFSPSWRVKLKDLGSQSNQWGDYIKEYIINPWFNEITFGKYGFFIPIKNQPKLIYTNVLLLAMHKLGKHMLKSTSVDKIIENKNTQNKTINLDSGFVMFIDSTISEGFLIFNKDDIQNEIIQNEKFNIGFETNTTLLHFINGYINYKKKDNEPIININKKVYNEMECNLPIELLKIFKF